MDFETKQELIDFVRKQFGVILENDETHPLNQHPDLLYTVIPRKQRNAILSFFRNKKIETNELLNYMNKENETFTKFHSILAKISSKLLKSASCSGKKI